MKNRKLNKKGLLLENFLIAMIIFSVIIVFGFTIYSSNSNNYPEFIKNNDSSQFEPIANKVNELYGTQDNIKSNIIDGVIESENIEQQATTLSSSTRLVFGSASIAKNVSGIITKEIAFGGDEKQSASFLSFINLAFTLILSILISFAILYLVFRFKAQN